jgi:hypothetical protein
MEKELIAAGWKLIQALDHYQDCLEGYSRGSASISEATAAGDDVGKAKSELWDLLKKAETKI